MSAKPCPGDPAPGFTLPSTAGDVALSDVLAKGPVLLVFYPGDGTRVCTRQLCDYRDNLDAFAGLGVQVLAINPQSQSSHQDFAARHGFPFPLLTDRNGAVCRAYGALGLLGMAKRTLVLVGADGRVLWRYDDLPLFFRSADEIQAEIAPYLAGPDGPR